MAISQGYNRQAMASQRAIGHLVLQNIEGNARVLAIYLLTYFIVRFQLVEEETFQQCQTNVSCGSLTASLLTSITEQSFISLITFFLPFLTTFIYVLHAFRYIFTIIHVYFRVIQIYSLPSCHPFTAWFFIYIYIMNFYV